MKSEDFVHFKNISQGDIEGTGADIKDVQAIMVLICDRFISYMSAPVYPLKNGFTSGDHSDPAHQKGMAGDLGIVGIVSSSYIVKCALRAGANVIGLYWNGVAYSIHLGKDKENYRFWSATRITKDGKKQWKYDSLIVDPHI